MATTTRPDAAAYLRLLPNGRFNLDGRDLTCGDVVELSFQRQWRRVRIEHDGQYYGIRDDGKRITLEQDQTARWAK